jgi:hypothetical protein
MKVGHGSLFLFLITNGTLSSANLMLKGEVGAIVDKLKDMLKTSKEEGEEDDKLYKKFKAYCEKSTEEKTKSVQDLTGRIEMLKGKIAELLASNGELSIQCSKLRTSIHSLKDGIASAKELREKQHDDFLDVEKDNEKAMKQCKEAIKTLAEIGADQTQGSSAEHEQFMAGFKGDFTHQGDASQSPGFCLLVPHEEADSRGRVFHPSSFHGHLLRAKRRGGWDPQEHAGHLQDKPSNRPWQRRQVRRSV